MKTIKIILVFALLIFVSGCESFDWFRSEGTVKKELQGTWRREFLTDTVVNELWTFKEGNLSIFKYDNNNINDTIFLDNGKYSVDTKITASYLKTSELVSAQYDGNLKWTIVQLEKNALYLAAESEYGLLQREFEKEK